MNDSFERIIASREALRDSMLLAYAQARAILDNGQKVHVVVREALDPIRVQQRRFLHGVVLKQISEQVKVPQFDRHGHPTGKTERYVLATWKEHFRDRFLGTRVVMRKGFVRDKETGLWRPANRKTPHIEPISSETLGVRRYSLWIDEIIDTAIEEFGVAFDFDVYEREEVRYRPSKRTATDEVEQQ